MPSTRSATMTRARAANAGRDIARYRDYLHGQVRELLTNYGPIDIIWFDFSYPKRRRRQGPRRLGLGRLAR